jgi:hypothetical protein
MLRELTRLEDDGESGAPSGGRKPQLTAPFPRAASGLAIPVVRVGVQPRGRGFRT